MSGYSLGRRVEYDIRDRLIAVKAGQVLFVNVKRTSLPGPAERRELVRVARLLPGVALPIIARGKNLLRIADDGTDPKACVPFATDIDNPPTTEETS